jgi:hypothetical protein
MQTHCLICDASWEIHEGRENKHIYCLECRRTETKIDYGHSEPCIPWKGDFDLEDNPMKNGKLYKPGERRCNHKDCVQPAHIMTPISWEELEAERLSIYYRTKRKKNWSQLIDTLQKEKMSA